MVRLLAGPQVFPFRTQREGTLHDRDPAAQRDGHPAHGSRPEQYPERRPHPQRPHARQECVLGAGNGPRFHRHRIQGGRETQGHGHLQGGHRPRGVPQARLGMEGGARRHHPAAAPQAGLLLRLGPHPLHDGTGSFRGGYQHLRVFLPQRMDLQGRPDGELGPRGPHGRE